MSNPKPAALPYAETVSYLPTAVAELEEITGETFPGTRGGGHCADAVWGNARFDTDDLLDRLGMTVVDDEGSRAPTRTSICRGTSLTGGRSRGDE